MGWNPLDERQKPFRFLPFAKRFSTFFIEGNMKNFKLENYSLKELKILKERFQFDKDQKMLDLINDEIRTKTINEALNNEKKAEIRQEAYDKYGYVPESYIKDDDDYERY